MKTTQPEHNHKNSIPSIKLTFAINSRVALHGHPNATPVVLHHTDLFHSSIHVLPLVPLRPYIPHHFIHAINAIEKQDTLLKVAFIYILQHPPPIWKSFQCPKHLIFEREHIFATSYSPTHSSYWKYQSTYKLTLHSIGASIPLNPAILNSVY